MEDLDDINNMDEIPMSVAGVMVRKLKVLGEASYAKASQTKPRKSSHHQDSIRYARQAMLWYNAHQAQQFGNSKTESNSAPSEG